MENVLSLSTTHGIERSWLLVWHNCFYERTLIFIVAKLLKNACMNRAWKKHAEFKIKNSPFIDVSILFKWLASNFSLIKQCIWDHCSLGTKSNFLKTMDSLQLRDWSLTFERIEKSINLKTKYVTYSNYLKFWDILIQFNFSILSDSVLEGSPVDL